MSQPSASDVKNVIDTDLADGVIDSFISDAYTMLLDIVGSENETVQKYLTAHLITVSRQRQIKQAGAGSASVTYSEKFGKSLDSTTYGQIAMTLDNTNKLASASSMLTASIRAIEEDYA